MHTPLSAQILSDLYRISYETYSLDVVLDEPILRINGYNVNIPCRYYQEIILKIKCVGDENIIHIIFKSDDWLYFRFYSYQRDDKFSFNSYPQYFSSMDLDENTQQMIYDRFFSVIDHVRTYHRSPPQIA